MVILLESRKETGINLERHAHDALCAPSFAVTLVRDAGGAELRSPLGNSAEPQPSGTVCRAGQRLGILRHCPELSVVLSGLLWCLGCLCLSLSLGGPPCKMGALTQLPPGVVVRTKRGDPCEFLSMACAIWDSAYGGGCPLGKQ